MKIDNIYANELLLAFRKGERIKEFMDAVSGVKNYRLDNCNRQGCIRGIFAKEIIADQFLIELKDIISVFWQGVLENVDRAKLWNESVEIKIPGKESEIRATNNNPIHFLRKHGSFAVRTYITSMYRKNIRQACNECGHISSIKNDKVCKKCNGMMHTMYKFIEVDKAEVSSKDDARSVLENSDIDTFIKSTVNRFAEVVLQRHTKAYRIMKILTDPEASIDMCAACKLCPAKTFDIDSCTNYNANIGNFLGVNKTMIASKVRSIRKRLPEFLYMEHDRDAEYLLSIIPRKYKSVLPVVNS